MKKKLKLLTTACVALSLSFAFAGCSSDQAYVTSIRFAGTNGNGTDYAVAYSDGREETLTIANGRDGEDCTSAAVSIDDVYAKCVAENGEISYADFLREYLTLTTDTTAAAGRCLQSSLKVYTTFVESASAVGPGLGGRATGKRYSNALHTGSAVIWKIDGSSVYIVTNYHVIYDNNADETANGGKTAKEIYCYLYGSEGTPAASGKKDETYGYSLYEFGEYAVQCELIGGSITTDLAVLKADASALKAINPEIRAVTPASGYSVGETAMAIGNPEGAGISVTKGIVSVDNEYIALKIDDTARYYRSIRTDSSLYSGNSGGGLFNGDGELIGITNAGNTDDQNINYAIPVDIVTGAVENILHYHSDGNDDTEGAYKISLGLTVRARNAKYVYDAKNGSGKIVEEIVVDSVAEQSIAERLDLAAEDAITGIEIDGTEYSISRNFEVSDLLFRVWEGSVVRISFIRDGKAQTTEAYSVRFSDLTQVP